MFKNYLIVVLRNMRRYKSYAAINVAGFALGMATCILIFLWVRDESSFDRFHANSDRLYRVIENQKYADSDDFLVAVTPAPLAPQLAQDHGEIVSAARVAQGGNTAVMHGERSFTERIIFASPEFFDIFSFPFVAGDPTAALSELNSMVISQRVADKLFGNENPLGRTLQTGWEVDFVVTGVIENVPVKSHLQFDLIVPFLTLTQIFGRNLANWGSNSFFTYLLLQEDVDYRAFSDKIAGTIKAHREHSVTDIFLQPLDRIHLHSDFTADVRGHGSFQNVVMFSAIALIVLLIASINFMSLSTARSASRAKEIGLRKVIGARRNQLIVQFLGESMLLTAISTGIALLLVEMVLPTFNSLVTKNLSLSLLNAGEIMILAGAVVLTGLLAGSYPAMVLSSIIPIKTILGNDTGTSRKAGLRKILVVGQFALATILMIGALVVLQQLKFIQSKNLGYDRDNLVYIWLSNEVRPQFETLRSEWQQVAGIRAVSSTSRLPTNIARSSSGWDWAGKDPESTVLIHQVNVDYDYLAAMGLEMTAGRFYSRDFPSDITAGIVVNEAAVRLMAMTDPIGARLTYGNGDMKIIGVAKNFHFKTIHHKIEPLAILLTGETNAIALIKLDPTDLPNTLAAIESIWGRVNSDIPFELHFMDEAFDATYRSDQQVGKLFNFFSFLAITIAGLGLFGLAAYSAERRTKEIGIRKVLGASISGIVGLLSGEFVKLVLIANLIAWPLAWFAMRRWLENFAYRNDPNLGTFVLAGLLALTIALVTTGTQAVRAATANPVESLRYE